ncbi:simple sugar transport system permease protein [Neorhizobium huautlense]|uniref:Simple sugar transport system permease protein n=1 Tax=Neorhizobium huautlense TaxID=67774 RepID=A0ABT9PRY9_9HYPH|nr:ABC transporter permease [Neorhizobium huautlense]MDP9837222.1 simple sugar transport system permease protein [Neorhizobium huautlense]
MASDSTKTVSSALSPKQIGGDAIELMVMALLLAASIALFSFMAPGFLSTGNFSSMALQLPELAILSLAMFVPIISGGLNLSVTFTANIAGLTTAWLVKGALVSAGFASLPLAIAAGLAAGGLSGFMIGVIVAYVGAHPILVTLGAMIFLRGLGEFLTRGGDISGMPEAFLAIGNSAFLGIPMPMLIFLVAAGVLAYIMQFTRAGFAIHMIGSNLKATEYSGINVKKVTIILYTLSGVLAGLAGMIMLARFNSVRVGHGESYLLITILACFMAGANPFGGFGRVLPLVLGLMSLQVIASGMNLMGASQHLATAVWGAFLIAVMIVRAPFLKKT